MADPNDQFKQKGHAEQIKAERAVIRMTGQPRSAIRNALSNFAIRELARTNSPKAAQGSEIKAPPPSAKSSTTAFEPTRFSLESEQRSKNHNEEGSTGLPAYPGSDGDYVLTVTISGGTPTLAWESISD